jgi:hypothetical protein
MSKRKVPAGDSTGIPELVEFMRAFPIVAVNTLRTHRRNQRGDCTGCCTGTRFERYPCGQVLSARIALPPGLGDGSSR